VRSLAFRKNVSQKNGGDPIEPCSSDTTYYSGTGWGFTPAAGWEAPLGRRATLRPRLAYHHRALRRLHSPAPDKREVSGSTPLRPITEKRRRARASREGVLRHRAAALPRDPLRESSSDDRWPQQDPYSQT